MALEGETGRQLVRRKGVSGTLYTAIAPRGEVVPRERRAALYRVGAAGTIVAGAATGIGELAAHTGIVSATWSWGEAGILATAGAGAVGVAGVGAAHAWELVHRKPASKSRIRQANRSFYRRVGIGAGSVGVAVAAIAAGVDVGTAGHGLTIVHDVVSGGEVFAGIGVAAAGVSHHFQRRDRRLTPASLGER